MRKILYIINALLITLLASCSKDLVEDTITGTQKVTIHAVADFALANGATDFRTRAGATIDRYMIEVYTDAACANVANVFTGSTTHKATNENGVFTMTLDKEQTYYCLLWADNGASAVYDVTDLKAVSLKSGATPVEGFYGKLTISEAKPTYDIALHRAVACVLLQEKGTLPVGTLTAKFSHKTTFNVSSATTSGNAVERIENITVSAAIAGTAGTPVVIGNPIYLLAPTAASENVSFTFQYASNAEFSVADVPIQANFNSKITGSFNNDVNFTAAKVGDFYMKDGTWLPEATTLTATQQADCIGIVYVVNPDGTTGKIVSLDEATNTQWSTERINTDATSDTDGASNTANVFALVSYIADNAKYPAFAWCATKNTSVPSGISWYPPAKDELVALYGTKTAVNISLTVAGATVLTDNKYWSCTQLDDNYAWYVYFNDGATYGGGKNFNRSVRVVSAF